jgi:hypothetical protein
VQLLDSKKLGRSDIELHALKAAAAPCCNELMSSLSLSTENERERELEATISTF